VVPRSSPSVPVRTAGFFVWPGEAHATCNIEEGAVIDTALQWEIVGRIALAATLGGVIGLEREFRGYPAGVRTLALVCMGSALFADLSRVFGGDDRIAAQIVSGIGFLGAGLIFREGYSVKGVTTAATIWATAAVGIAIGAEGYILAVFGSLFAIVLLELRVVTKNIRPSERNSNEDHEDIGREPEE
jgi:putative Mg2+ transporter-C (MgtC) family protein